MPIPDSTQEADAFKEWENDFFDHYNRRNPSWEENSQGEIKCEHCGEFKHRYLVHEIAGDCYCDYCIDTHNLKEKLN